MSLCIEQFTNNYISDYFHVISFLEFSLNGGAVHVVAEYLGRELYNVKHKVCKMGAETFSCPIEKGMHQQPNIWNDLGTLDSFLLNLAVFITFLRKQNVYA